jgi:hypothetical protein
MHAAMIPHDVSRHHHRESSNLAMTLDVATCGAMNDRVMTARATIARVMIHAVIATTSAADHRRATKAYASVPPPS